MRTFEEIVTRALNLSKRTQVDVSATDEELVDVLNGRLQQAFDVGRQANPWAFMEISDVDYTAPGWVRPDKAQMVLRIELGANREEVAVVPFDQQNIEPAMKSVYRVGMHYEPVQREGWVPEGQSLRFFYSRLANDFVAPDPQAELDPLYPRGHERLLALGVAVYLAKKDGRFDDAQAIEAEVAMEVDRLKLALASADPSARRLGGL